MKRTTAKDREAFALRVREVVFRRADGRVNPDNRDFYELVITETKCGPLYLHVADAGSHGLGFVAGRFLYPDRGVAMLGAESVNKYSGKWNHHYWHGPVDEAIADFERALQRVTGAGGSAMGTGHEVMGGEAEQE